MKSLTIILVGQLVSDVVINIWGQDDPAISDIVGNTSTKRRGAGPRRPRHPHINHVGDPKTSRPWTEIPVDALIALGDPEFGKRQVELIEKGDDIVSEALSEALTEKAPCPTPGR